MRIRDLTPLDPEIDAGLGIETCRKLNQIFAVADVPRGRYSVNQLPPIATWGNPGYGLNDNSEVLCVNNRPVTLLFGAQLSSATFYENGLLAKRARVFGIPILPSDLEKASHIVKNMERPVRGPYVYSFTLCMLTSIC